MTLTPQQSVLNAFIQICNDDGIANATLQKAAKKAKIAFSTAHYHWGGNSDRLITAALLQIGNQAQQYIEDYLKKAHLDHKNPVEAYVMGTFEWALKNHSQSKLWIYFFYHASIHPLYREQYQQFIKVAHQRVLALIYEAKGRGFYKNCKPNLELASGIHALIFSFGVESIIIQSKKHSKQLIQICLKSIQALAS